MIARSRDGVPNAASLLTRHFFNALFDFGVFTQAGADAFVRVIIGLISLLLALGFLLVYMYAKKYAALFAASTGEPYAQALLADTTLAIALPMWIVALVTVLVSHSLFPDETDFRVLIPLPIGRGLVFGAKLLALALFAGVFTLASHVAITPLVMLISAGRWAANPPVLSVLAFWVVSVGGAGFALLVVTAIQGLLITCIPRGHVHLASAVMRSAMLGVLVLALPFVMALPTQSSRLAQHSTLLLLAPPAWFMGVERVLLGHRDAYFIQLAQLAGVAFVFAAVIACGSYISLYRRFDRVMLRSLGVSRRSALCRRAASPARAAVRDFTAATLRRSALHHGVVVGLSACGVALALNILFRNGVLTWLGGSEVAHREILGAVAGMPFPLIIVLGIAAKASLALPIEPRANWVFRVTERDAIRADQLRAAERVFTLFAALIPVALTLPIQWMVAGPRAIVASAMTGVFGLLWVEALLRDWRRIPFTCAYMPGKRSVAQSSLTGLGLFVIVSTIGGALETASLRGPSPAPGVVIVAALFVLVVFLRRRRRLKWREVPLAFDDDLPSDVQVFRLSGD
jgi:hypothetical protein